MAEDIWDEYSSRYDKLLMKISFYRKLIKDSLNSLKDCEDPILDAGCGTGNLTLELAKMGKKVVAIDSNPGMVRLTKQKVVKENLTKKVEVLEQDLEDRRWENEYYGGVASLNVIFAVKKPFRLLDNMYKCLKDGGKLVIVGPKDTAKPEPMIEVLKRDCYEEDMSNEDYKIYCMIQDFVRKVSSNHLKFKYSTSRIEEILIDFVGFKNIEKSDQINKNLETYVNQGYFISAIKEALPLITTYKIAEGDEISKVARIRYHMLAERLNVLKGSFSKNEEKNKYDDSSIYFIGKRGEKISCLLRVTLDSEIGFVLDNIFDISRFREKGKTCEITRWIALPFSTPFAAKRLFYEAYKWSKKNRIKYWIGFVDKDERKLNFCYKVGFKKKSGWKPYRIGGIDRPGCLIVLDLDKPGEFLLSQK